MAYFSNGSDGAILDDQCANCPLGELSCPARIAHDLFNYEQFTDGKPNKVAEVLDTLVNEEGICQLKPLLAGMTPPEPERVYDPMPGLKDWALKHGLAVRL